MRQKCVNLEMNACVSPKAGSGASLGLAYCASMALHDEDAELLEEGVAHFKGAAARVRRRHAVREGEERATIGMRR